jgi:hypothetical protein
VLALEGDGLLDILQHPNESKYPNQRILVVALDGYIYLVPFVEEPDNYFLKTIISSRKAPSVLHKYVSGRVVETPSRLTKR